MNAAARKWLFFGGAVAGTLALGLAVERYRGLWPLRRWQHEMQAAGEQLTMEELQRTQPADPNSRPLSPQELQVRLAPFANVYNLPSAMSYVAPGKARVISAADTWDDWSSRSNSWTVLAQRFEPIREPLEQLRADLRNQALVVASDLRSPVASPQLAAYRATTTTLSVAVLVDLHERRLDAALQNLVALLQLDNLMREERLLSAHMLRLSCAHLALNTVWEALQTPGWTEAQLAQLQAACAAPRYTEGFIASLQVERAVGDATFGRMRLSLREKRRLTPPTSALLGSGSSLGLSVQTFVGPLVYVTERFRESLHGWLWQVIWSYQDQLCYDRSLHASIAGLRRLLAGLSTLPELVRAQGGLGASTPRHHYDRLRFQGTAVLLPKLSALTPRTVLTDLRREITVTAIALKRYELRFGRLAPSLAALAPDFLPELPRDHGDGQTLRYRPQADGTFVLYSVGADGRDNQGLALAENEWYGWHSSYSGRDLVWPLVATAADLRPARRRR
jgi:hypothetical protein